MLTSDETAETQHHEEMPCLAFEQMLGYVEKTLSPAKRAEVEKHLTACEFCSEALEGFAAFPEKARLRPMVESVNEQIQARYAVEAEPEAGPSLAERLQSVVDAIRRGLERIIDTLAMPRHNLRLAYVVASVFLVGIVSVLYLGQDQPTKKLFAEYYQRYPNIASSVRGELTEGKLQDALQQYDAGDYKAALKLLQEILAAEPDNAAANFYAGVSYLKIEESARAVFNLQKVIALGEAKFSEPAEWYLALAFLQQNDLEKTHATLEIIIAKDHVNKAQAIKLLERLRSSEQ
jgi:tetratricopeptide (TPR) repeat protein